MTGCRAVEGSLAELALGTLGGRDRAAVLAHLEECPRCTAEVEQLSTVADALIELAPEEDPPAGFERRLLARMGPTTRPARRWPRAVVAAAAVVAAVALAFGGGWLAAPGPGSGIQTAMLRSAGHARGDVVVAPGQPAHLLMTVHGGGGSKQVHCEVTTPNGRTVAVGSFWLYSGSGSWTASLPVPADQVQSTALIGPAGGVVAQAVLRH